MHLCLPTRSRLRACRHGPLLLVLAGGLLPCRAPADTTFTAVTASAGITHQHSHGFDSGPDTTLSIPASTRLEEYLFMSGGAVAEDFDGDGWMDLYVLQGGESPNLLYINQGDGTFAEEAAIRGGDRTELSVAVAAADYDGDGDVDIAIGSVPLVMVGNQVFQDGSFITLLINDGSGFFSENTLPLPAGQVNLTGLSWGDIDSDGDLDLAFGSWDIPLENKLSIFRNDSGTLVPYLDLPKRFCHATRFADIDNDRDMDLMVAADFGHAEWFLNNGFGIFLSGGTSDIENGMGNALGDIDNDGDLDWFMSSIRDLDGAEARWGDSGNRMLANDGSGNFSDVTDSSGTRDGNWGWGAEFADFDHDGDLDLFHGTGWPVWDLTEEFLWEPARLFDNDGTGVFTDIAASGSAGDAGDTDQGRCTVVFDYDNDGDQDIFIANNSAIESSGGTYSYLPGPPVLLRNDSASGNWLKVSLSGITAPHHSHGIGSRVYLTAGGTTQMRELNASGGFNGHGPNRIAHFGLAAAITAGEVRARWMNGDETVAYAVSANQHVTISSPSATVDERDLDPGDQATFAVDAGDLPAGGSAIWTYEESTFGNPASITFFDAGEHSVWVDIYDASSNIVRSESLLVTVADTAANPKSVARLWNEQNLAAIRIDFPDPTKHARNLFHTSIAMYDAWAAYASDSVGYLYANTETAADVSAARDEAVSYAAYRVLYSRYENSVNGTTTTASLDLLMSQLGYDTAYTTTSGTSPADLGNRIAETVLGYYENDGWDVSSGFLGSEYLAVNDPLPVTASGTTLNDPNRWQPLLFEEAITQNGQTADILQSFLGANWGAVRPFAHPSFDGSQGVFYDPGLPPQLGGAGDADYKAGSFEVVRYSSLLDPDSGLMIDISPGAYGNNPLGTNDGTGRPLNPVTGLPYEPNLVNHADFARVLAEFWADGPESETPPGHWNVLANELVDHPDFERRYMGSGPELEKLEWDVKVYFVMNAALHDSAIAAWGCKRVYDYIRPVSSIRHIGGLGQSSDPLGPSYHALGMPLSPGVVEVITADSATAGGRHEHLSGHLGEIAVFAWVGADGIDPESEHGGCDWILAEDWLPYQRDTFVTPAFAGYVSGHSTFSRAAAEVLTRFTGSAFFPGGMGTFTAHQDEFLEFENGPTTDVELQWATYYDAADQAGISRLYGGIHVPADDGPGRIIGAQCGLAAWELAVRYFDGGIVDEPVATRLAFVGTDTLELRFETPRGAFHRIDWGDDIEAFSEMEDWERAEESFGIRIIDTSEVPGGRKFFKVTRSHPAPAAP